jgi:hypothetical protein
MTLGGGPETRPPGANPDEAQHDNDDENGRHNEPERHDGRG